MLAFAGGAFPFLAFLILFLVGVIISLYTRKGSGMDHHPYSNVYGGAPGAALPCGDFSGADRTSLTERQVVQAWRLARLEQDPEAVAARLEKARELRRRQRAQRRPNLRVAVRPPVPVARKPI